jgi:hypothetical protein
MGSGLDDWIYWLFHYNYSSHIELLLNFVYLTNHCHESPTDLYCFECTNELPL